MKNYAKYYLEKTVKIWQPYSTTPLSLEDAREITNNMTSLLSFLVELEKKYGKEI